MRFLLLLAMILVTSTAVQAEDLPQNAIIINRSSQISIYDVKAVAITHDTSDVQQGSDYRVIRVNAALEISLNVEGNLCGSNPRDVFISSSSPSQDQTTLSLHYKYAADPFTDILSACAAYSAPRDVTVALRLYDYAFNTGYEKTFTLLLSYDQSQTVNVNVRYDDILGLVATIIR